jgi:hypothetical protein
MVNSSSNSGSGKTTITLSGKMDYPDPSIACYLSILVPTA